MPDLTESEKLACAPLFGSHSDDRTQIHYGAESPALMCGRHASYLSPSVWEKMRDAGTVPAFPIPKIP